MTNDPQNPAQMSCPIPLAPGDHILLAHGEGARWMRQLVRNLILESFDNPYLHPLSDGAVLPPIDGQAVVSTDSFVVSPLFFPGGDIGTLAVHGTINDLAVSGAEPLYLSLALIIEEGLPLETLRRVILSLRDAAGTCGVQVVTGDTKVVPKGAADGLFINTTGIGRLRPEIDLGLHRIRAGDRVLVSGTIGDHGMAILSAREQLNFETTLESDTAPLFDLVQSLIDADIDVHFLRDPTRGGVSAVMHEIAEGAGLSIIVDEGSLPVSPSVRGACELLGLDPVYVANEGKLVAIVCAESAERALKTMRESPLGAGAAIIGEVTDREPPQVLVRGPLGAARVLDEPSGAPLPRIC